jgi:signal transduction histidine kinase
LRTPLNAILGYTDLMKQDLADEGKTDSQEYEDLGRVIINARNLLALINDILDLSKVEANKMTLSYDDVSVPELLDEIRASVDPLIDKGGNEFTITTPETLSVVNIDRQKVSQCLRNLLSNAAKFTHGGRISLKTWAADDNGAPLVFFEVTDTGKGMTPQQCADIFDEFVQIEDSDQPNTGGTGLGLPISKRFCRLMGGDIKAESSPGAGSRFTMWVRNGPKQEDQKEAPAA